VGLALTLASDCACATCTVGGRLAAIFLWPKKNAMKSAFSMIRAIKVRTLAGLATGDVASRDGTLMAICRGKSAIKRVATVRQFMCVDESLGNVSINAANLQAALSRGIRDNFAASCQGSTSDLASAEMTLSGGRSLPSSTEHTGMRQIQTEFEKLRLSASTVRQGVVDPWSPRKVQR